jgi:hypothetical protein
MAPDTLAKPVSIVSTSSVVFNLYVNTNVTAWGVEYCSSLDMSTNSCNLNQNLNSSGSFNLGNYSATVTNLLNTYYHYRFFSENSIGRTYSNIYTFSLPVQSWQEKQNSGSRSWMSVTSSSDGTKLAATVNSGYIYTSNNNDTT